MLTLTLIIGGWISSGRAPSTCLGADLAVRLQQLLNAPVTLQHVEDEPHMQQLLNQSEHHGPVRGELRRPWMNDQPSHLTPHRVNGLISP